MAALPPEMIPDDEKTDEPEGFQPPEGFQFLVPEEPTMKEMAWNMAQSFALFLLFTAAGAYAVTLIMESLQSLTGLGDVDWKQAFCALILLRIIGLALGRK